MVETPGSHGRLIPMSNLDLILQQNYVAAAAIIPPIAAVILQATVDAKARHISRSKVGATHSYCVALYSLSVLAGITYVTLYNTSNIYAIGFPIQSLFMLAVFFSAPTLHRKSGFKPAETHVRLYGMASQQQDVISFLQTHFQREGLMTYPGEKVGCTVLAVSGKVDAKAFAGKQRRYRIFVTLAPAGDDLTVHALADVKEYVIQDSWETQVTTEAIRKLEQYLVFAYGQAVELPNALPRPRVPVPPPFPAAPPHQDLQ